MTQNADALGSGPLLVFVPGGTIQTDANLNLGSIQENGRLIKTGPATLNLTQASSATGGIEVQAGKLSGNSAEVFGDTTQTIFLSSGATLEFTNTAEVNFNTQEALRSINIGPSGATISVSNNATTGGQVNISAPNSISGSGPLTKAGIGALRMFATQETLASNWTINAGTLEYGGFGGPFPQRNIGSGSVTVNLGGQFAGGGPTISVASIILNGGDLGTGGFTVPNFTSAINVATNSTVTLRSYTTLMDPGSITVSGVLSGSGELAVNGLNPAPFAVSLNLTNRVNTFTGTFRVNAGQTLTSLSATGSGSTLNGAPVILSNASLAIRDSGTGSGGILTYGNNLTVTTGNSTLDLDRSSSGANMGNTVDFGTLTIGAQTLAITAANGYKARFSSTTLTGNATLQVNTELTLNGAISGAFTMTKTGPGRLALNGDSTFTGAMTVRAGVLGGDGSLAGALIVSSPGIFAPGNSPGTFNVGGDLTLGIGSTLALELGHGAGAMPSRASITIRSPSASAAAKRARVR